MVKLFSWNQKGCPCSFATTVALSLRMPAEEEGWVRQGAVTLVFSISTPWHILMKTNMLTVL